MFNFGTFFGGSDQPLPPAAAAEQERIVPTTRDALLADTKRAGEFFTGSYNDESKERFFASGPAWLVEMATEVPFGKEFFLKDIVQAIITIAETSQATRPEEIREVDVQKLLQDRLRNKEITAIEGDNDKFSARMGENTVFDVLVDDENKNR